MGWPMFIGSYEVPITNAKLSMGKLKDIRNAMGDSQKQSVQIRPMKLDRICSTVKNIGYEY